MLKLAWKKEEKHPELELIPNIPDHENLEVVNITADTKSIKV